MSCDWNDTSADSTGHTFIYQDPFGKFSFVITGLSAAAKQLEAADTDCTTAFERINETFRRFNLQNLSPSVRSFELLPYCSNKAARWFDCFRTYAAPTMVQPDLICRRTVRALLQMPSVTEQRQRKRRRFLQTIRE